MICIKKQFAVWTDVAQEKKRKYEEIKETNLNDLRKQFLKTKTNQEALEKTDPILISLSSLQIQDGKKKKVILKSKQNAIQDSKDNLKENLVKKLDLKNLK